VECPMVKMVAMGTILWHRLRHRWNRCERT
jgi:hypothetical protein